MEAFSTATHSWARVCARVRVKSGVGVILTGIGKCRSFLFACLVVSFFLFNFLIRFHFVYRR